MLAHNHSACCPMPRHTPQKHALPNHTSQGMQGRTLQQDMQKDGNDRPRRALQLTQRLQGRLLATHGPDLVADLRLEPAHQHECSKSYIPDATRHWTPASLLACRLQRAETALVTIMPPAPDFRLKPLSTFSCYTFRLCCLAWWRGMLQTSCACQPAQLCPSMRRQNPNNCRRSPCCA